MEIISVTLSERYYLFTLAKQSTSWSNVLSRQVSHSRVVSWSKEMEDLRKGGI